MVLGLIGGFQMKDSQGGGVSSRSYRNARVTGDDAKVSPFAKASTAPSLGERRKCQPCPLPVLT